MAFLPVPTHVRHEGWLHIKQSWTTGYKRRWFALLNNGELSYKIPMDPIDTKTALIIGKSDRKLIITDQAGNEYRIKADSRKERDLWLKEIRNCKDSLKTSHAHSYCDLPVTEQSVVRTPSPLPKTEDSSPTLLDPLYFHPNGMSRSKQQSREERRKTSSSILGNMGRMSESEEVDENARFEGYFPPISGLTITSGGRQVKISWSSPERDPLFYILTLQELKKDDNSVTVQQFQHELNSTSYFFTELKSNTHYRCNIEACYLTGYSPGICSDIVKTDPRSPEDKPTAESVCISHKIKSLEPCNVRLFWENSALGENYKVCSYHLEVVQLNIQAPDEVIQNEDFPAYTTSFLLTEIEVTCQYQIELTTTFQDLDTDRIDCIATRHSFWPAPTIVQNVEVTRCDVTGSRIEITWDEDEKCDKYELLITTNGQKEAHLNLENPCCVYSCLNMGGTYVFQARACCGDVVGMWSNHASVTLVPGGVHLKSAKVVDHGIELRWIGPDQGVDTYAVRLFGKSGMIIQEVLDSRSSVHKFEDLLPGHLYHCSVSARNSAGFGRPGKSEWIKIPWNKPGNFSAYLDPERPSSQAFFNWSHPAGVDSFRLVIDGPDGQRQFETAEPQFSFKNGSAGIEYSCHLYCGCNGLYDSDSLSLEKPLIMGPDPPSNIQIMLDKAPNVVKVKFDEPAAKVDKYKMTAVDLDENTKYEGTYVQPNCYFNNLERGKRYRLLVQSINSDGILSRTAYSDVFCTYPPKVTDLNLVSSSNDWAQIKWKCSSQYVNCFLVRYKCGNRHLEEFVERPEKKIKGLKRGKVYYVEVAAENSAGRGEFSEVLEFQTALKDLACVKVLPSQHQPAISLVVELKDRDFKAKTYVISAKAKSDGNLVAITTQQLTSRITGLRPGETYDVFARSELGNKVSKTAYTPDLFQTVPDRIQGLAVETIGENRNILHWDELLFPCKYRVKWKSSTDENYTCENATGCSYEWKLGLKPGTKYQVQVAGENRSGLGEWSEPWTFTTVGQREDTMSQNGDSTMLFEGQLKKPTIFQKAQNVCTDSSTHMGDVRVLHLQIQGQGDPKEIPALGNDPKAAILNAIDDFFVNEQQPGVRQNERDQPGTSGLSNQAFCLEDEGGNEQQDENTIPKTPGPILDETEIDDQQLSNEEIEGEDFRSQQSIDHTVVNQGGQTPANSTDGGVPKLRQRQCVGDGRNEIAPHSPGESNKSVRPARSRLLCLLSCCVDEQSSRDDQAESLLGSGE